jgi:hypothetical protein
VGLFRDMPIAREVSSLFCLYYFLDHFFSSSYNIIEKFNMDRLLGVFFLAGGERVGRI